MSQDIHRLAQRYRHTMSYAIQQTQRTLDVAHSTFLRQVQPDVDALYQQVKTEQEKRDDPLPISWLYAFAHFHTLLRTIRKAAEDFTVFAHSAIARTQYQASKIGARAAQQFMHHVGISAQPVPQQTLEWQITQAQKSIEPLLTEYAETTVKEVQRAVHRSLVSVDGVKGLPLAVSKALDIPRWKSRTVASAEGFRLFNTTLLAQYQTNEQHVMGWVWNCRLSPTSCAACVALHGSVHRLDEVLVDHPYGQCFATPYIAGMSQLQKGVDWFEAQDEQTKRGILRTDVAYNLYVDGKTDLHAFVGVKNDPGYAASVYQKSVKAITGGS